MSVITAVDGTKREGVRRGGLANRLEENQETVMGGSFVYGRKISFDSFGTISEHQDDEEKEEDRARKKTPRNKENDRTRKKTDKEKAQAKARMKTPRNRAKDRGRKIVTRARSKQKREDMSCSFEKTKVWEVPGKDYYNDEDISKAETPLHILKALDSIPEHRFFVVTEWRDNWIKATEILGAWIKSGQLRYKECVGEGLENAPDLFRGMLKGKNFGKQLVKIID